MPVEPSVTLSQVSATCARASATPSVAIAK